MVVSDSIVQRLYHGSCSGVLVVFFAGGKDVVLFNGGQRKCHESVFEVRVLKEGGLTARNCLRELCCELVSAIVYAIISVYGCVYFSRIVLYICPSDRNRCWMFGSKCPVACIKIAGNICLNRSHMISS